jgi:hypothetical protein
MEVSGTYPGTFLIRNVIFGAATTLATIYSRREQMADFADIVYTANSTTDVLTSTAHPFSDDDEVIVSNSGGAPPSPLVAGTGYFVRDATANTLKLAATLGGAAINLTTNGTGTNSLYMSRQNTFHFRTYQVGRFSQVPKGFPVDTDESIV